MGLPLREVIFENQKSSKKVLKGRHHKNEVSNVVTDWVLLNRHAKNKPNSLKDCEEGVLYHPAGEGYNDHQFPVGDFFWVKKLDSKFPTELTILQASTENGDREITLSSWSSLFKKLGIDPKDETVSFKYIYSGHPRRVSPVRLKFPTKEVIEKTRSESIRTDDEKTNKSSTSRIEFLESVMSALENRSTFWIASISDTYLFETKKR